MFFSLYYRLLFPIRGGHVFFVFRGSPADIVTVAHGYLAMDCADNF